VGKLDDGGVFCEFINCLVLFNLESTNKE
jgi:hypothetical protein